jgi:heat shock protein 1/8
MAEPEEIEKKQKEIESKFNPIMMRVYQASGGAPGGAGSDSRGYNMPGEHAGAAGPTTSNVEDLD